MTTSVEKMLDWTLEDGKWKDSFDKLFESEPPLRELNIVKKKVRASFNFDSSIENSKDECFLKKPKRVKKKVISTPVRKLPQQPFICAISPINTWRQNFLKSNKPKGKPVPQASGKLQSTIIHPAVVVTDYDCIKEKSVTNKSKDDTLSILLTQPHKVGTLRRRRPHVTCEKNVAKNKKKNIKEQHNKLEKKRVETKRTLKVVEEFDNIGKKLPNATNDRGLQNILNNKNTTHKVLSQEKSYTTGMLQNVSNQTFGVTEDLPLECISLQKKPVPTCEAVSDLSHECMSKTASTSRCDLIHQKRTSPKHAVELNSLQVRKDSKTSTIATRRCVRNQAPKVDESNSLKSAHKSSTLAAQINLNSQVQEITACKSIDEEISVTPQNVLNQKHVSRTAKVSLPKNIEDVPMLNENELSATYETSESSEILITEASNTALSTNISTETFLLLGSDNSYEPTSNSVEKIANGECQKSLNSLEAKSNEECALTSLTKCSSRRTLGKRQSKPKRSLHATIYQNQQFPSSQIVRADLLENLVSADISEICAKDNCNEINSVEKNTEAIKSPFKIQSKSKRSFESLNQKNSKRISHLTATFEKRQSQQKRTSHATQVILRQSIPTENTTQCKELLNQFEQNLQPIEASPVENLKPTTVSVVQKGNNESISFIDSSVILPRKTVKFKDSRRTQYTLQTKMSSKDQHDHSDIVLIESNNQCKNDNEQVLLNSLKSINGRRHLKSLAEGLQKTFDEPLRPIKSFNDRLSKRNVTANNTLQPGKWRKSLNALRRSQLSQVRKSSNRNVCQLDTIIDIDESVEYVSSSTFIGTRKTILLKEQNFNVSQKSFINIKDYKKRVLEYCDQVSPISFNSAYAKEFMKDCQKIGEGVYGEVFIKNVGSNFVVCKIIPIEGTVMVNGEVQKTFEQILPEIVISKELCRLKNKSTDAKYSTCGFVDIKKVACVEGKYPEHLVKCWEVYDGEKTSENDHPGVFDEKQLYIVLELEFAGKDLETFEFYDAEQSFAALQQIVLTIAVAEEALQFEHRDLHWGNVLLRTTDDAEFQYKISGETLTVPTKGIKATIIDYTLSRIKYEHHCFYNDLANDEELFTATGDYQFDIYRMMRDVLGLNWEHFEPRTNVFWISYIISKMQNGVKYKSTRSKNHSQYLRKMRALKKEVLEFKSAFTFAKHLLNIS